MTNKLFLLLISCMILHGIYAIPLDELVNTENARILRSGESVAGTQLRNPQLSLLPQHSELRQYITGVKNELDPGIVVETLYLYKKSADASVWSNSQINNLFNRILALSTLTGIQYYSASRNSMRTFYESSVVIDNPSSKNPLSDPVFTQPPSSLTLYARQKDLTFGDNIYRYDYTTTRDAFFFTQENITALTAGIIPAIGKNKLRSVFAIIDCGDSLLIYAVSMAKATAIPGMGDRISNSFGNRAEAIYKWFTSRADGIF